MVVAPIPGAGKRAEASDAAKLILTITLRGENYKIAPNNMPLSESFALRKATGGLSLESFWSGETSIGVDSVKVLWWLARRANGERDLSLVQAEAEWPNDLTLADIDVSIDEPDPEDNHPEA